ncbi:hypothetical protein BX616_000364, partial [Lobosporangium transversale]
METFIKDYDKILKKQRALETNDPLDRLIAVVNEAKEKIQNGPESVNASLATLSKAIKTVSNGISEEQKELQSALTKYSKAIDKEAGLTIPDAMRHQFVEMFDIHAALKENNLEPALLWATRHRSELEKRPSTLEFKLHRQRYLQLLQNKQTQEAIVYARKNFGYFGERHTQGKKQGTNSYFFLVKRENLNKNVMYYFSDDIQHMFTRDFCSLIGLPCESPLYVSVTVGTQALPTINKMVAIMKAKKTEWSQQSELP